MDASCHAGHVIGSIFLPKRSFLPEFKTKPSRYSKKELFFTVSCAYACEKLFRSDQSFEATDPFACLRENSFQGA